MGDLVGSKVAGGMVLWLGVMGAIRIVRLGGGGTRSARTGSAMKGGGALQGTALLAPDGAVMTGVMVHRYSG